jgi:hypothetical protein
LFNERTLMTCPHCAMVNEWHQYNCPTVPKFEDVYDGHHYWIAFMDSPYASCAWCGKMKGKLSSAPDAQCRGIVRVGLR